MRLKFRHCATSTAKPLSRGAPSVRSSRKSATPRRLRALFDAVVVGAGTVRADDPLLTTRHCPGPSPIRVVIDTDRRLGDAYRIFAGSPHTILVCADDAPSKPAPHATEVVTVPRNAAGLDLDALIAGLKARGLRRIFIEGGGLTVSRFLAAGLLDRLHVTLAPLLLGSGIPAFTSRRVASRPGLAGQLDGAPARA